MFPTANTSATRRVDSIGSLCGTRNVRVARMHRFPDHLPLIETACLDTPLLLFYFCQYVTAITIAV